MEREKVRFGAEQQANLLSASLGNSNNGGPAGFFIATLAHVKYNSHITSKSQTRKGAHTL